MGKSGWPVNAGPFWLNNSVAIVKTLILTCSKISACFFVPFFSQGIYDLSSSPPANTSLFWKCYYTFFSPSPQFSEGLTSLVWTKSNCLLYFVWSSLAFERSYVPEDLFTFSNTDRIKQTYCISLRSKMPVIIRKK